MPWKVEDVDRFKSGLTEAEKRRWVEVANDVLARCLADGGEDCEATAIQQANGVVEEAQHEHESLRDHILEAVFDEGATFKATIQGFLKAAKAVTSHPHIPKQIKKQIDELRQTLASKTWVDLAGEPAQSTATASEATGGPSEQIVEEGAIVCEFVEDGALVGIG